MADAITDLIRLALLDAWSFKCVWCRRPLFFNEMEVEHLIPKSLDKAGKEAEKAELLKVHGLRSDHDLHALENLAPSCRPCNEGKGPKPPPDAPGVAFILHQAIEKASVVRDAATKMAGDRRIENAAAILRAGVEVDNPKAVSALREAAELLHLAVQERTGHEVARLHTALSQIGEFGGLVQSSDTYFDYVPTAGRPEGPIHEPPAGTVMSYAEVRAGVVSRIDVVPRDPEALERYGPEFTLSPTNDAAGERAIKLLNDALRSGRGVEIEEGLDVTFDRLPPLLADAAGRPLTGGTVKLVPSGADEPRRPIPEWRARFTMTSGADQASLSVRLKESDAVPAGWDGALVGERAGLRVTSLFRRNDRSGEIRFDFKHASATATVREALDGLRFMELLSRGGEMVVADYGKTKRPKLRMKREPSEIPGDARGLLSMLEDLAEIENATGAQFQLPEEIKAAHVRDIARVAKLVRTRKREVTWTDATLNVLDEAVDQMKQGGAMRVEQSLSAVVLGLEIDLGTLQRDLPAFELTSAVALEDQPGLSQVTIKPATPEAAKITEVLLPRKRVRRNPPPPSPKKAAAQRKKARKRRHRG